MKPSENYIRIFEISGGFELGVISSEEWKGHRKIFQKIDTDRDEFIDLEDVRNFMANKD